MRQYLFMMCAAVVLVITGCGGTKSRTGGAREGGAASRPYPEFRLGVLAWPGPISFKTSGWIPPGQIESLVVQKLVEIGPDGQPKLGLATSVEHPNSTTYVYDIKRGVRFSDGNPLTIADVVYSLDLNWGKLFVVKEAWEDVRSVSSLGSSSVVIKLKRPSPDWPDVMIEGSGVIEKAAAEQVKEEDLGTQHHLVIGSGPWKFDSYTPEVGAQLSRNPYWSGPRTPAEKITVTVFKNESTMALALRSGAIDAASGYEAQKLFVHIPGVHQLAGAQDWVTWMSLNTSVAPFDDIHVRRAIAYATDVNGMIRALYPEGGATGDPTVVPLPLFDGLGSQAQVSELIGTVPRFDFDVEAAKRELAKSSYPHGFTTEVLAVAAEPILLSIGQIVAEDLAKIGIVVKVRPLQNDEATFGIENKKMFLNEDLSYVPNQPDFAMSAFLSPANIYPAGNGNNWAQYKNAALTQALSEVVHATVPGARIRATSRALDVAAKEVPYVPLFTHSTFMAVSDKYVDPTVSFYTSVYSPWALNMRLAK